MRKDLNECTFCHLGGSKLWASWLENWQSMTDEQIADLVGDLDCGLRCFVHKETKAIVTTPNTNDPDSDSEVWNDAKEEIENNFDNYVEIKKMGSNESFRLMQNFVETVENERLRDRLDQAL